jgi:uncharacterized membrane protein YpjA
MKQLFIQLWFLLTHRNFLILLFLINLVGTIIGYWWYEGQLAQTEPIYYIFVPDSPTASLFFTIALFGWILGKSFKLMEVLAVVTLIKYGVWAVAMNLLTLYQGQDIGPDGWMLVISHGLMAVQAILYLSKYTYTTIHFFIAAVWTLHNDAIDYLFGQMPVYRVINEFPNQIGYFTFWLSIICLMIAYIPIWRNKSLKNLEV